MIRSLCGHLNTLSLRAPAFRHHGQQHSAASALLSTYSQSDIIDVTPPMTEEDPRYGIGAFLHHGTRPRIREKKKFDSPRKKANKMFTLIMKEHIEKSKEATPEVWQESFRVGDAIEIKVATQGGSKTEERSNFVRYRGAILGIYRRKLDHSILIRDVIDGHPIEQIVPLHSPMVKSLTVLEKNFVFQGKKKVKRAKLYYLSERNPNITKVTGSRLTKNKALGNTKKVTENTKKAA
mmetsp:Transcript_12990/g.17017  ORF Transcript_12990/g.17017 Transcript_12990/m.17017 type:complete len:236 (-) Transcript_12990:289-996(-)|eukprot:CAMPEP_0198140724 /NCGR_PEP_ID=MMETSP1443-20131203/3849_1 /TAXON_ID=186043 /ORGANISM="Entomoneis sp., Strain CCMP2396" /LENGTH=235 /DNA_ID=CAMNT_0043803243 /DNA_START=116 /DNA_END=823 /DNA_ORIENTATION=-